MKKALSILLSFVMLMSITAGLDFSSYANVSGDWEYEVLDYDTAIITSYNGKGNNIKIPSKINGYNVKGIGDYAFHWCESLTNVTIPNSVISIGDMAFRGCTSLKSITIPNGVIIIDDKAFESCDSLTSINVDSNNKFFSSQNGVLFNKNKTTLIQYPIGNKRTSYVIPNSVTSIGDSAFEYCKNLTNLTIPNSVTSIVDEAFRACSLNSLTIPNSVKSIGSLAFCECDLKSIAIPDSVTNIGDYAFYNCYGLTSVTIGNGVTSIGSAVFSWCYNLTSVTIGNSVTSIDINGGAFSACTSLTNITVDSDNKKYSSQDGVLFNKNKTKLMLYPCGNKRTSYAIPTSVTSIGDRAFFDCEILTSISIPNSVTSIGYIAFERCTNLKSVTIPNSITSIDDNAFCNCDSLTSINVDSNNKNYLSQDGVLFNKNKTTLIQYPIGNTRTSYTIPNSVTKIGTYAFSGCKKLKKITVPKKVKQVGWYAFFDCDNLKEITILNKNTKIEYYAFGFVTDTYYEPAEPLKVKGCKIYGYKNSTAEKYAKENGIKFKALVSATLSSTSYTYNGKVRKPSVTVKDAKGKKIDKKYYTVSYSKGRKNVGKYTVTIKFKGNYSGTVKKTFTIKPKATTISKVTAGKKAFTVKWKKQATQTTGYQIQYSTDKNFKKNNKTVTVAKNKTTSKKISKLKAKKKYYVRIRTYKIVKVNGKNTIIYSGWSKVKNVKTK